MSAKQFKKLRRKLGMTGDEFAHALGYEGGKTTIYRKEKGLRPITKRDILAAERLLDKKEV